MLHAPPISFSYIDHKYLVNGRSHKTRSAVLSSPVTVCSLLPPGNRGRNNERYWALTPCRTARRRNIRRPIFTKFSTFNGIRQGARNYGTRAKNGTPHSVLSKLSLFLLSASRLHIVYIHTYVTPYRLYINYRCHQRTQHCFVFR